MNEAFSALLPLLSGLILTTLRVGVAFASIPAPFGSIAPTRVRTTIALMVSCAIYLPRSTGTPAVPLEILPLMVAGSGELLAGAVIGLTARVTLAAAEVAGTIAGHSMGLGFAASVDPVHGEQSLPTGRLFDALAMLIFLAIQGHHTVIASLALSFRTLPIGQAHAIVASPNVIGLGGDMLARGLQMASPVVSTMFIVSIASGLVARAAPRVNLFALSFAVASAAGLLVLWTSLSSIAGAAQTNLQGLADVLMNTLGGLDV